VHDPDLDHGDRITPARTVRTNWWRHKIVKTKIKRIALSMFVTQHVQAAGTENAVSMAFEHADTMQGIYCIKMSTI